MRVGRGSGSNVPMITLRGAHRTQMTKNNYVRNERGYRNLGLEELHIRINGLHSVTL